MVWFIRSHDQNTLQICRALTLTYGPQNTAPSPNSSLHKVPWVLPCKWKGREIKLLFSWSVMIAVLEFLELSRNLLLQQKSFKTLFFVKCASEHNRAVYGTLCSINNFDPLNTTLFRDFLSLACYKGKGPEILSSTRHPMFNNLYLA